MNSLLSKINEEFEKENCLINNEKYKQRYQCDIIFEKDENDDDKKEKYKKDNIELKLSNSNKENCTINVELYQSEDKEYILRFLRISGSLGEYYSKVKQLISIAQKEL